MHDISQCESSDSRTWVGLDQRTYPVTLWVALDWTKKGTQVHVWSASRISVFLVRVGNALR